jgi:hypothetical protein
MDEFSRTQPVETLQPPYHLFRREVEADVLPYAREREECRTNLGKVAELSSFAAGRGATVAQLAIAWTLANPAVQVAIVGARQPGHIEHAVAAADLELDAADLARIEQIMSGAVAVSGPSPEAV